VESENQKKAKLAIEEQSKKKYDEKYKDVRQDKMKYFNARKEGNKTSGLKYVITKKRMAKNRQKAQHYSSIMQVF
jgi:peptidylprolyl isomerase